MSLARGLVVLGLGLLLGTAIASNLDARGWNKGQPAANAARVLAPLYMETPYPEELRSTE